MDSFKEVEYLIKSLFSVALNRTTSCTTNGKLVMSDERMQYLSNIIKDNINIKIESFINDDNTR